MDKILYFEQTSRFRYVTSIFVVVVRILPDAADLLLEGRPTFEIRDTSGLVPASDALNSFLDALERHRMLDYSIVITQIARR